jgi:hypothetical protein
MLPTDLPVPVTVLKRQELQSLHHDGAVSTKGAEACRGCLSHHHVHHGSSTYYALALVTPCLSLATFCKAPDSCLIHLTPSYCICSLAEQHRRQTTPKIYRAEPSVRQQPEVALGHQNGANAAVCSQDVMADPSAQCFPTDALGHSAVTALGIHRSYGLADAICCIIATPVITARQMKGSGMKLRCHARHYVSHVCIGQGKRYATPPIRHTPAHLNNCMLHNTCRGWPQNSANYSTSRAAVETLHHCTTTNRPRQVKRTLPNA